MQFKCLVNVNHDNIFYPYGSEIELSDAEAAPLLECKAIEPLHKAFMASNDASAVYSHEPEVK